MDIELRDKILAELLPVLGLDFYECPESTRMDAARAMEGAIKPHIEDQIASRESIIRDAVGAYVDCDGDDDELRVAIDDSFQKAETLRERIDELVDEDEGSEDDDARIRLIDAKISDASNAGDLWREVYWDLRGGDRDLELGPEDAAATEPERGPEVEPEPWKEHYRDLRARVQIAVGEVHYDSDLQIDESRIREDNADLASKIDGLDNLTELFERHRAELSRALAEALNPRITIQAGDIEIGPAIIASDIVRLLSPDVLTALCLGEDATEEQVLERINNCSAVFCLLGADLDWPVARVDAQIDTISDGAYSNWIQVCSHLGVNADWPAREVIAEIDNREETPIVLESESESEHVQQLAEICSLLMLDADSTASQIGAKIDYLVVTWSKWTDLCDFFGVNPGLDKNVVTSWITDVHSKPLAISTGPVRVALGFDAFTPLEDVIARIETLLNPFAAGGRI